jgi:cytochrome c peroxidase
VAVEQFLIRQSWQMIFVALLSVFAGTGTASSNQAIEPIPLTVKVDSKKVELGKKLFFDKRLSADNSLSCASCHALSADAYGTDRKSVSTGINGQQGNRNSPTVFNSSFNLSQFWDGRAETLADQAIGPVINPLEMGMASWDDAVAKLKDDQVYISAFKSIYNQAMSAETITDAIAEFEKTLITANSPFDQFLRGDLNAITEKEKRGFELFKSYGCISCHQGRNVGGNMYQKFGVLKDIVLQGGSLSDDLGRYNVTRNEWDKRVFKVPSLRLAVKTAPYFHDGSVATINEAVNVMIQFQLGRQVPEDDQLAIIAFLESLVGKIPKGVQIQ